jgi:hypothetical protein
MNNKNIKNTIKSTLLVLLISSIGALGCYLFHLSFIASFLLFFALQYIIFSFIGNIINNYYIQITRQKELDLLEPLSTFLECAYCKAVNLMTFLPNQNERIEFECEQCKKRNLVNINFSVARITESVNIPDVTRIPLVDEN